MIEHVKRAERRLGRIEGQFIVTPRGSQWQAEWNGSRRDRGEAERVLIAVLAREGIEARSIPGLGVWAKGADEARPAGDHEAALHNAEPSDEAMTECGAAAE